MSKNLMIIKKLEEKCSSQLSELDLDFDYVFGGVNGYAPDENKNIIGLNLWNLGAADISEIKALNHLTQLDLSSNQLTDISALKELKNLTHLHVNSNQLSDISVLTGLKNLTDLHLEGNQLSDISPLKELKNLTVLNISSNRLLDISALRELMNLSTLHLKGNQLSDISPLGKLKNLTLLNLSSNQIRDISPLEELKDLNYLYLNSNQLSDVSALKGLKNLTTLHLSSNPLSDISILKELNNLTLLNLSSNQLSDISVLKELEKLTYLDLSFNQIRDICGFKGLKNLMQLNLKSNQIEDISGINRLQNLIRLDLINNRIPQIPAEILQLGMDIKWEPDMLNGVFLQGNPLESPPVEIVKQGSPAVGNYFKELEDEREQDEKMPISLGEKAHLHNKIPRVWMNIRNRLEAEEKSCISLDDYMKICQTHGLNEERAEFLSGYLHDLGVILHYRDDKLLKETVFLDPAWADEAVNTLMQSPKIRENNGRFVFDHLKSYWDLKKFPVNKHAELIRLMEKFELCFNHRQTGCCIIPSLLSPNPPPIEPQEYKTGDNLYFEYFYPVMPTDIIDRFISRNYYLINDDRFWKNGVELKFGDSNALVTAEPQHRKIKISVYGAGKNQLQAMIRTEFRRIHKSLDLHKNKNYHEMQPCICSICLTAREPHLYKYGVLEEIALNGIPVTHCPISGEDVSVKKLMETFDREIPPVGVVKVLLMAAAHLHGIAGSIKGDKESRNGFIIHSFFPVYKFKKEVQPWGVPLVRGKTTDRPDIKILNYEGHSEGVMEAFILKTFEKNKINHHLTKVFGYKPRRRERLFIVVYAETDDFPGLWKKYLDHLPGVDYQYPLTGSIKEEEVDYRGVRFARANHLREEKRTEVCHLFINMKH